jgi:hypothetical protein
MKAQLALISVCAALVAVAGPAEAKGCAKGAVVGGVGGHVAGHHGLLGAAAGCAVGRHHAKKMERRDREQQAAQDNAASATRSSGNTGAYASPTHRTDR